MNSRPESVLFTLESLSLCVGRYAPPAWFEAFACPEDGSWGVVTVTVGNSLLVLDREADETSPRIVILLGTSGLFALVPPAARATALQRIHRLALQAQAKTLNFPPAWSPFQAGNKLAVFAYPPEHGNDRLIAAVMTRRQDDEARDLLVCELTTEAAPVDLKSYKPDAGAYDRAVSRYRDGLRASEQLWSTASAPQALEGMIDLEAASYGAVTRGRTYSTWLSHLSSPQRLFVERPPIQSLKLRGPAGSGKTLALELKALKLLYDHSPGDTLPRIAFLTHSWAAAQQVEAALRAMDERGLALKIDVLPLLAVAEDVLPPRPPGYTVLGEDSYSGKLHQLRIISQVLSDFHRTEWVAFRRACSEGFQARLESPSGTSEHDTFVWDLMLEFSCVILANGILPGINALQRYLKIQRMPWMMHVANDVESRSIMQLYTSYIRTLESKRWITNDQIIADYLNFLATFHWHATRRDAGYDFVFIDELHLFNEQERLVFHQLTRDPDAFPILFMALDPRQAPTETYVEFKIADPSVGESGAASMTFGQILPIDLHEVHRYTPQILEFLKHLDGHFPALELGDDWRVTVQTAQSTVAPGEVPILVRHPDAAQERNSVIQESLDARARGERVAILCVDYKSFAAYCDDLGLRNDSRYQLIQSRDDVEQMRYARRSIVVSMPQFVAGLQFDTVILAGLEARFSQHAPHQGYELRRFVSSILARAGLSGPSRST